MSLIVTADDLGLSDAVNRGILESCRKGIVRSTSLLVTLPLSEEAAEAARREKGLEIGLHIDLVEGKPISDPKKISSLVNKEGTFMGLKKLLFKSVSFQIESYELATEIRAQAKYARKLGVTPLAWDSHRYPHLFPPIANVFSAVAREEGAQWIRRSNPLHTIASWKHAFLGVSNLSSSFYFRDTAGNDRYIELTGDIECLNLKKLQSFVNSSKVIEIGSHPGLLDKNSSDLLKEERPLDLEFLTDQKFQVLSDKVRWRVNE